MHYRPFAYLCYICTALILTGSRGLLQVMPDALSKTVPIWCAVVNRTLFPEKPRFHGVQFPPNNLLGASEESQIESRIDGFVAVLKVFKPRNNDPPSALTNPLYRISNSTLMN